MRALKITYKDPAQLKPRAKNPRTHTAKQIKQIAASIKQFGFISPVLLDAADGIIAGHARVEGAKLIGMTDVPTVRVAHLTPAQIRAYVIADNRLAENAGWDRELLALELRELSVELNFDVTVTGFETAEVDLLISELHEATPDDADQVPEIDRSVPAVSRLGDRWRIGDHVLLCGDALDRDHYLALDVPPFLFFVERFAADFRPLAIFASPAMNRFPPNPATSPRKRKQLGITISPMLLDRILFLAPLCPLNRSQRRRQVPLK